MNRINKIEKYIINRFCMNNLDLNKLNDEIDLELEEGFNVLKNDLNDIKLVSFFFILNYNKGSIEMGYLNSIYNNKKHCYFISKLFYHINLIYLINNNYDKDTNLTLSFSEQGEILLMNFACNNFQLGNISYNKIIENIQSGKMANSLPMYIRPQKLGVLAIEMLASEKKETIDWESAGIPIDPFYQRFCQEALYCENEEILIPWLMELCDKHIQWSSLFGDNSNEKRSTGYEIDSIILLPWPFEYQAVKNFRARHGLSTPIIDHPLLKTPMAIDHRPDMVGWLENMPEIYHHITDDLIKINPELKVIHTLF